MFFFFFSSPHLLVAHSRNWHACEEFALLETLCGAVWVMHAAGITWFPNVAVKPQTCSSIRCFVEKFRATVQWKNGHRQPNMSNHMGWFYVKLRKWHLNTFLFPNSWNPFKERDEITKKLYTQHAGVFSQMLNTQWLFSEWFRHVWIKPGRHSNAETQMSERSNT